MNAAYPAWLSEAQSVGKRYSVFRFSRLRHNTINLISLGALLVAIAAILAITETFVVSVYLRFLIETVALGQFYFAIHVLVIHEASHNMFLLTGDARTTKRFNRAFGIIMSAYFGIDYVAFWEIGHAQHHRDPIASDDPQNCAGNTLTGRALAREVVKVLISPVHALLSVKACPSGVRTRVASRMVLSTVQAVVFAAILLETSSRGELSVFAAAIFGFGVAQAMNLIKISMEHGGTVGTQRVVALRSKSSEFFLRPLVMPFNISMHFEHHLNATIPWYALKAAHNAIVQVAPEEWRPLVFNLGLRQTLGQMRG